MAKLDALTPCADLLPVTVTGADLVEAHPAHITSLAPYRGRAAALSAALKETHGLTMPDPGRTVTAPDGARAIWSGMDQALVLSDGPLGDLAAHAAITDQSDGWAVVVLSGPEAEAVLARLTPHDLNAAIFKIGHTARTLVQHINVVLTRLGPDRFEIMCLRSFAGSLIHDLTGAMRSVAGLRADQGA